MKYISLTDISITLDPWDDSQRYCCSIFQLLTCLFTLWARWPGGAQRGGLPILEYFSSLEFSSGQKITFALSYLAPLKKISPFWIISYSHPAHWLATGFYSPIDYGGIFPITFLPIFPRFFFIFYQSSTSYLTCMVGLLRKIDLISFIIQDRRRGDSWIWIKCNFSNCVLTHSACLDIFNYCWAFLISQCRYYWPLKRVALCGFHYGHSKI